MIQMYGQYWLAWTQNLCTSSDASMRVGPFPTREEAERFRDEHIVGYADVADDEDEGSIPVVAYLWDYTPDNFLSSWASAKGVKP